MNERIGLLDLIYQVKNELLTRRPVEEAKGLPALFWIDQIELELSVAVTRERGGSIKVSVIPAVGTEMSSSKAEQRGHTVKVRMTPLLSRDQMFKLLSNADPDFKDMLAQISRIGLARESTDEEQP
ncbi:MAG: hypothetical protein Kow0063_18770 [Anaerolineae bacterium]